MEDSGGPPAGDILPFTHVSANARRTLGGCERRQLAHEASSGGFREGFLFGRTSGELGRRVHTDRKYCHANGSESLWE